MRKIVLSTFSAISLLSFNLFISLPSNVRAQDCVDYDIGSYPKLINDTYYSWNGAAWNFTNLKQSKRTGLNIANNFKGLLEYVPASYNAQGNSLKKYPVIIFFHGYGSRGTGTVTE